MIGALTYVMVAAPVAAIVGCLVLRSARLSEALNLVASAVAFCCALPLPFLVGDRESLFWSDYILVDRTTAWVVMCTAIVYFLASVYAVGYMRLLNEDARLFQFYALFAGFGATTLAGPLMNSVGIYWIAIELTTLVSTFLVAFEREAESMEAAWKYIMVVSAGISLALLGTVLFYWGGSFVLGPTYNMTWSTLAAAAPQINPVLLTLAFLLVLVG
jgi:hydrogenase-4 component F